MLHVLRTQYPKNARKTVPCRLLIFYPYYCIPDEDLRFAAAPWPASYTSIVPHITSSRKDQNSKCEAWFLY